MRERGRRNEGKGKKRIKERRRGVRERGRRNEEEGKKE